MIWHRSPHGRAQSLSQNAAGGKLPHNIPGVKWGKEKNGGNYSFPPPQLWFLPIFPQVFQKVPDCPHLPPVFLPLPPWATDPLHWPATHPIVGVRILHGPNDGTGGGNHCENTHAAPATNPLPEIFPRFPPLFPRPQPIVRIPCTPSPTTRCHHFRATLSPALQKNFQNFRIFAHCSSCCPFSVASSCTLPALGGSRPCHHRKPTAVERPSTGIICCCRQNRLRHHTRHDACRTRGV